MKALILMTLIFFSSITISATATDYYVSSIHENRKDSNAGTSPDAPWATIDKVKNSWPYLKAGDTVHLERGSTWNISFSSDYWRMSTGGSASGGHITFRGDDYGSGTRPIIRRTGGSSSEVAFLLIQESYITVRDFEFNGGNSEYGYNTTAIIINADNKDIGHINILNTKVHNLGGNSSMYVCGIWTESWSANMISDCLIEGNEVSDYCAHGLNHYSYGKLRNITWRSNIVKNHYTGGRFGANSALQITSGSSGCLFEYNYLEDTTGSEGIIFAFSKYSDDDGLNTIRHNIVKGSPAYGISFWRDHAGYKLLYDIYGNIILNNARQGLWVFPSYSFAPGSVLNFYNNTLYNNATSLQYPNEGSIELRETSQNLTVRLVNNLIWHTASANTSALGIDSSFGGNLIHNNNLYWSTGGSSALTIYDRGTYYTLSGVQNFEPSAQNSDPMFINTSLLPATVSSASGADPDGLSVQAGSPAIGNGENLGSTYASDIDLSTRSDVWTIGAYEKIITEPPVTTNVTSPSIVITAPADQAIVSGRAITVSANASDDTSIADIEFQLNGTRLSPEGAVINYSVSWDTTRTANGLYTLTAVVRDAAGNTQTSEQISVTVNNEPLIGAVTSSVDLWENQSFSPQTDVFSVEFDAVPNNSPVDCVTGLASGTASSYDDLAVIVRFQNNNQIDVRNGDIYTAERAFSYTAGETYHFRIVVDLPSHTYDVYVQTGTDPEALIADTYAFRSSQNTATTLNTLAMTSGAGSHTVSGFSVEPVPVPAAPAGLRIVE